MLFTADDFKNSNQSNIFRELENLSPDVKPLASKLKDFCAQPSIDQLEPLETLLRRTDPVAKTAYDRGLDFLHNEQYSESIAEFKKAIALESKYKEAQYGLGLAYLQMGNLREAEKAVTAALRIGRELSACTQALGCDKTKTRCHWI